MLEQLSSTNNTLLIPPAPMLVEKSAPLLFLDIDGVLNTDWWLELTHKYGLRWLPRDFTKYSYNNPLTPELALKCLASNIQQDLVMNLRWLVESTGANIVFSSSWRTACSKEIVIEALAQHGFPDAPVIGRTIVKFSSWVRSREIMLWLEEHAMTGKDSAWVVLDDINDQEGVRDIPKEHKVITDPNHGLTRQKATDAIALLKQQQ